MRVSIADILDHFPAARIAFVRAEGLRISANRDDQNEIANRLGPPRHVRAGRREPGRETGETDQEKVDVAQEPRAEAPPLLGHGRRPDREEGNRVPARTAPDDVRQQNAARRRGQPEVLEMGELHQGMSQPRRIAV